MKWGLIGASDMARTHMVRAIRATGGEIAWVMSRDPAGGRAFADEHGIPVSRTDPHLALRDGPVDAVYVSSLNDLHHDHTIAALDAGAHALCEKPLSTDLASAVRMVRAARASGRVLATNHHLRGAGSHQRMAKLIQDGRIGRVQSMRVFQAIQLPPHRQGWRVHDRATGGVIADILVHAADIVRFHLNEDPAEVVALSAPPTLGGGVDDNVVSAWSMPSGAQVMVHVSFTHPFAGNGIEIHGTDGSIIGAGTMTSRAGGEVLLRTADGIRNVPFSPHSLHQRVLTLFNEAAEGRGEPAATGVDGAKAVAVAQAVAQAAATGLRTAVDYGGV